MHGLLMRRSLSLGLWRTGNRVRRKLGKHALPKRCCRKPENRVPHTEPGLSADVTVQKCSVCGCRHFEALVEPGHMGLRFG